MSPLKENIKIKISNSQNILDLVSKILVLCELASVQVVDEEILSLLAVSLTKIQ